MYQLGTWIVCLIVVLFLYYRSGSLTAALTVGLALFLASFRFTYGQYQQFKREILEQEHKNTR